MIHICKGIVLDERILEERFVRAPGPGGQHVNKVATAVELRFDVVGTAALPDAVRVRLLRLAGRRLSAEGVLIIQAHRFRTQEHNRRDALERLVHLIRRAAVEPKLRRPTRPTRASKERRLASKSQRSKLKGLRKHVHSDT